MRVGLSHLREHKFKHSTVFRTLLIRYAIVAKILKLLYCTDYLQERMTLLNTVSCIVSNILDFKNGHRERMTSGTEKNIGKLYYLPTHMGWTVWLIYIVRKVKVIEKNDFVYFIILSREILVNGNYYLCAKYFFNYPRLIYCNIFLYAKKIFNL